MITETQAYVAIRDDGSVGGACFTESEDSADWCREMESAGMKIEVRDRAETKRILITTVAQDYQNAAGCLGAITSRAGVTALGDQMAMEQYAAAGKLIVFDKESSRVPFYFTAHEGDLTHTFVLGTTGQGKTMNPVAAIGTDPYHVLYLLQLATRYELGFAREELAKSVALRVAAEKIPNTRDLVEAWKTESSLVDFADAVAKAMLPS